MFLGTIVSHDGSLHTGLVLPDDNTQAIPFTEGDLVNWDSASTLIGQRVSFDVVEISNGYTAIHMVLQSPPRSPSNRRIVVSALVAQLLVGPVLVALCAWGLYTFKSWDPLVAHLIAVNFIAAILVIQLAASPILPRFQPAEYSALLLALCGGSPAVLLGAYLLPIKLKREDIAFFLITICLVQFLALYKFAPYIFSGDTWSALL